MQCLAHIWPSQVSPPRDVLVPVTPENIDVLSSEREQIDPELQKIIDQYDTAIFDAFDEEKINATDDKAPKDANSWQDTAMDYVGSRSDSAASILPALAALNLSIDALDGAAIVQPPSHEGVSLPSDTENIKEGNNTYHIRGETIRDEPPLSQLDKFLAENLDQGHHVFNVPDNVHHHPQDQILEQNSKGKEHQMETFSTTTSSGHRSIRHIRNLLTTN